MKHLRRWAVWSLATKQRYIWIYGVVGYGGGMAIWSSPDFWSPRHSLIHSLLFTALWIPAGYLFGWIMWHFVKWAKPWLVQRLTSRRDSY